MSSGTLNYIEEVTIPNGDTYKIRDAFLQKIHYGNCNTSGNAAEKVITCETLTTPTIGDILVVNFTNTNTVTSSINLRFNSETTTYSVIPGESLVLDTNRPYVFYYDSDGTNNYFVLKDKIVYDLPDTENNKYRLALSNDSSLTQKEIVIPATANAIFYNPYTQTLSTDGPLKMTATTANSNLNSTFLVSSNGIRLDAADSSTATNLFLLTSTTGFIHSDSINLSTNFMHWDNQSSTTITYIDNIVEFSSEAIKIHGGPIAVATTAEIPGTNDLRKRLMVPVFQADDIEASNGKYTLKQIAMSNLGKFFNLQISISGAYLPLSAGSTNELTDTLYVNGANALAISVTQTKGATLPTNASGAAVAQWSYINFISGNSTNQGNAYKYGDLYCGVANTQDDRMYMRVFKYVPSSTNAASSNAYLGVSISNEKATASMVRRTYTNCKIYGAVWNDYAEYRQGSVTAGGYCVTETSSGRMEKSTSRLQPGCKITSDTFGFAIGESNNAKSPIAVSGRALVYTYRPREEYPLGAALCSAPNGTVDIMTREEIREYPERIIGTVSEIPEYEVWHGGEGNGDQNVPVDGRIWIYVK